jgi:hypothetical protein
VNHKNVPEKVTLDVLSRRNFKDINNYKLLLGHKQGPTMWVHKGEDFVVLYS